MALYLTVTCPWLRTSFSRPALVFLFSLLLKSAHSGDFCYNEDNDPHCDPNHWEGVCTKGKHQSPIDLEYAKLSRTLPLPKFLVLNKKFCSPQDFKMKNNGHTVAASIRWDLTSTSFISGTLVRGTYVFAQVHFHWSQDETKGSEHTVDGQKYPMEAHLVHYQSKYKSLGEAIESKKEGALTVLGVFFNTTEGDDNPALTPLFDHFQELIQVNQNTTGTSLALNALLPQETKGGKSLVAQYEGSLTTPPCSEIVSWNVFMTPQTMSKKQATELRALESNLRRRLINYRPVQAMNSRPVKLVRAELSCQGQGPPSKPSGTKKAFGLKG